MALAAEPPLPPAALAALLAGGGLAAQAAAFGAQAPAWGRAPLAGAVLGLVAAAWLAWALWQLHTAGGRGPRFTPPRLVDEGPYRFGRNPVALAQAALLAALALASGSPFVAAGTLGFVSWLQLRHLPQEEAALRRAYGGWYADYAASVPRWW